MDMKANMTTCTNAVEQSVITSPLHHRAGLMCLQQQQKEEKKGEIQRPKHVDALGLCQGS